MHDPPLVKMSDAEFANLRSKSVPRSVRAKDPMLQSSDAAECLFRGYCDRLLFGNEALQDICRQRRSGMDNAECWSCLTEGQRILYCAFLLDVEIENGGINQFFWNHPQLVPESREYLQSLGQPELTAAYEKAVENLMAHADWIELRRQFNSDPNDFRPFQASYELLDLAWFDDAYFARHGKSLRKLAIDYVESHKDEFISS